jgi:hypothetical protein
MIVPQIDTSAYENGNPLANTRGGQTHEANELAMNHDNEER